MFKNNTKTNMELEILEQLKSIPFILSNYTNMESNNVNIDVPDKVFKIVIVASGSSYHCARFAVDLIEKYAKIETRAIYSSEFLLKNIIPHDENTLYIFITQSGETSDTVKAVERVQKSNAGKTMCVTNVENSTIWNICDYKVSCLAGVEQGIAATKSFTAQMLCLILVCLKLIEKYQGCEESKKYLLSLQNLPKYVEEAFAKRNEIKKLARVLKKENVIAVTAEGNSYSLAKEAALKIKETSYKNITSAMLGEFMHGHVAVLNSPSTLIYISSGEISKRSIANLNQIKIDYNPKVVVIGPVTDEVKPDYNICVKCCDEIQQMLINIIVVQQLALEIALKLKRNVDSPKGLHKVVVDNNV